MGSAKHQGFQIEDLAGLVEENFQVAKNKLEALKNNGKEMNIGDMFEMQFAMQKLSQVSEMAAGVTAAAHQACMGAASKLAR